MKRHRVLVKLLTTPMNRAAASISTAHAAYPLRASVAPAVMRYNAHPVLSVYAPSGAVCRAAIWYVQTSRHPTSYHELAAVSAHGVAQWRWHEESKSTTGVVYVSCTWHGLVETTQASFRITH